MKNLFKKSLLLLIGVLITSVTTQMQARISFVVGVTGTGSTSSYGGSGYNIMKLCAQFRWDNTDKGQIINEMSKAGITFEGKDLYITSMTYDDAIQTRNMYFQKFNENTEVWSWNAYAGTQSESDWANYIVDYGSSKYSKMTMQYGRVYFDASNWSETDIKLVIGHANFQRYYGMTTVTGTKLYYYYLNLNDAWTDAMGCGVVGNTSATDGTNWLTNVSSKASEYTGFNHFQLNNNGENIRYLIVNNGKAGEQPTMNYSADYTDLNSTQTYNTVVKTIGGSYTSGNSKSTINISSYELTSQGGTTNRTPILSTSESSETVEACRTATTQLQVGTPATGYQFDGWYTAATSDSQVSNLTDYTYYPTSANTYYARFSEIARTVTVAYKCGGTSIKSNGSVENVGVTTAQTATAPSITGYTFSSWSQMPSGVSTSSSLTGSTISINATAASQTITANYTLNSHTLTWNLDGGTVVTEGTQAAVDATGTPSGSVNYGASITAPIPEKAGYTFTGWNTTPASTMPDNDITYTAQWEEITYTVSFANDGNGSTDPDEDQTVGVVTGVDISATPNTGYEFNTWTSSNGGTFTSAATTASNTFKPSANATLTASFRAKTYSIILSASSDQVGGGESTTNGSASVTYMGTTLTSITSPTRSGYEVDYYTRLANGNDKVTTNSTGTLTALSGYVSDQNKWIYDDDLTLYAHWVPKTYTITLDANRGGISGTNGSTSFSVTIGSNNFDFDLSIEGRQGMTPPTKEGFTFAGYYDDPDEGEGTKVINADGSKPNTTYVNSDGNWINTTDNLTLYAHWTVTSTYVFKGGASGNATSWSTAANWTKGVTPSANNGSEDIIILAPVEIPASATTNVNSVRIGTAGSYTPVGGSAIAADGKLTIPATAMLKVTTNVQNYNFSNSSASPTTESTLHIKSASTGNGALVWGASGSPGRAQVDFYTKSGGSVNSTASINQYIGTPFSDANVLYNYYNAWTFKVNAAGTAWERLKGNETMSPFVGYNVIYDGAAGHIFEMDGTLVTNTDHTCTLTFTTDDAENLLANSWTAPMWIKGFANDDFTNADASIYIFKSTSEDDSEEDVSVGGGNYDAYTPGTSGDDAYIPSMQSFSVLSSGGAGSVKLNYTNLVLNPASHTHIGAMHAPRRFADGETEPEENLEPKMDFLRLRVADTNGWADELKIYIREDFVEEFENGFDARKMYGDDRAPMLYGISPDGRMAINCIPTADNHVVGFHGGSASNEYTFRFAYDGEEELYLLDNKTGAETLISAEDTYSFTTEAGDNDLRFSIIRKTPAVPTDIETVTGEGLQTTGVQKIMYNGMLYILRSGRIYDATGALVK